MAQAERSRNTSILPNISMIGRRLDLSCMVPGVSREPHQIEHVVASNGQ